jgi:formylglycine-generating enzyme required for sulfatase activity
VNNPGYFQGQYKRLSVFAVPPAGGLQPLLQVVNTSETETLTAYLDNFDIIVLDKFNYYYGEFLNGDETDPSNGQIGFPADDSSTAFTQQTLDITLASGVVLKMASIPSGSFSMGSPSTEANRRADEGPVRTIQISKSFYIGVAEVTQKQWKSLMNNNPSVNYIGDEMPVTDLTWNDCITFIGKLNTLGKGTFRLPTEAEWEYCCRAGTTTRYYWESDNPPTTIDANCNYGKNTSAALKNVCSLNHNKWNLYDMNGNVWEFCSDWYGSSYSTTNLQDPTGPSTGTNKVIRGGSYKSNPEDCRSAARWYQAPDDWWIWTGFRVVREM